MGTRTANSERPRQGQTATGIVFPSGTDLVDPLGAFRDLAESADAAVSGVETELGAVRHVAEARPRFIRAETAELAQTQSATDPANVYWAAS